LVGDDGDIIEMSWYADRTISLPLGEDFHARRLSIRASQVGMVARARRHRRTNAERLALAVSLLQDPVFDVFLTGSSTFEELPGTVQRLADGTLDALCHVIEYPTAEVTSAPISSAQAQPTEATR
jgi:hypothetical protein